MTLAGHSSNPDVTAYDHARERLSPERAAAWVRINRDVGDLPLDAAVEAAERFDERGRKS